MHDAEESTTTAIVVAGDEETRVLLRGLLRLHHFRVEGEAEGATRALELLRDHRPTLMVADLSLAEGNPTALIGEARAVLPTLRVVLVVPASRRSPPSASPSARADVVLVRPFRIRQFADALRPSARAAGPGPG